MEIADNQTPVENPKEMAIDLIVDKNQWLMKIRWIYTVLIVVFLLLHHYFSQNQVINLRMMFLIVCLPVLGNIIFWGALKKGSKNPKKDQEYDVYYSIATLQLDFDLAVFYLLIYFAGRIEAPLVVMLILYIIISTFLIYSKKALRNTIISMFLLTIVFFQNNPGNISTQRFANMIAINLVLIFSFSISSYLSKNLRENERVLQGLLKKTRDLSISDGLTGLFNQTYFFKMLDLEVKKSKRHNVPFSLILFDVDHFKEYNDNNGHIEGSAALRQIGKIMRDIFRVTDIMAKYGGDEFVAILPNSDKVGAFLAADRLREMVEMEGFPGAEKQPMGKVTLSLGIASYPEHGLTGEAILEGADKAMYIAKKAGRNRTMIFSSKKGE